MKQFIFFILISSAIVFGIIYSFSNSNQSDYDKNSAKSDLIFGDSTLERAVAQKQEPTSGAPGIVVPPSGVEINKDMRYVAVLKTTAGDIAVELNTQKTPNTVANFIHLARKNFYNDTIFHRAIKDFMIQGGDPKGDGTGGPGYQFPDEPFEGDYTRGTMAMANAGPNTNGSQFFIMHQDKQLPKNYVIFGRVIKGIEVVDKIAGAAVEAGPGGEASKPVTPVVVKQVEIVEVAPNGGSPSSQRTSPPVIPAVTQDQDTER